LDIVKPETFWRKTKGMFGGDVRLRNTRENYARDQDWLRAANPSYVEKMLARE
jgi:hypothetical protein